MKKTIALTCAAIAVMAPALAEDNGAYAGLGYTYLGSDTFDFHTGTLRLGYDFSRYFGVEGEALIGLGDDEIGVINSTPVTGELDFGLGAFAKLQYPLGDQIKVFARAGYIYQEGSVSGLNITVEDSDSGFAVGGGAEYSFTPHQGVRLEYTRYQYGEDSGANGFGASYILRF